MMTVAFSLAFAGSATAAGSQPTPNATAVVPHLGGGLLVVYERLHALGLRVSIPRPFAFDSTEPPSVARSVPATGRRIRRGSVVTLYLTRGRYRSHRAAVPFPRYRVPRFVGATVDRAFGWVRRRTLAFRAYLGALSAGAASSLLANYQVTAQRPAAGRTLALGLTGRIASGHRRVIRLSPLTVWGVHPTPKPAPPPPPPQAQTGSATVTGQTTATLAGVVNPEGSSTTVWFSYGPTTAYGSQTPAAPAGAGRTGATVTAPLVSLTPASTYHYRLVATSRSGTAYGADQTFTTTGDYQNPVFATDAFPDPFVLDNGAQHSDYWAFATGDLFPVLHSTDLVHWTAEGTAMTDRPSWVTSATDWHPWAPSVLARPQPCPGAVSGDCYVMYYVGLSAQLNVNCIGVATSSSPGGPYVDQGPLDLEGGSGPDAAPLGCADASGRGNIDPSPFIDSSGQPYLYVSTDFACTNGANCALQPTISVIPLSTDFLHASGPRTPLFSGAPGTWEQGDLATPTVEGPSVTLHNGVYYLFYSAGDYRTAYGMGYATSAGPTGPFVKAAGNPILAEAANVLSPGGGDQLVTGPHGGLWLAYAARSGSYAEPRTLRIDPFEWAPATVAGAPDVPVIQGPTSTPQAAQP